MMVAERWSSGEVRVKYRRFPTGSWRCTGKGWEEEEEDEEESEELESDVIESCIIKGSSQASSDFDEVKDDRVRSRAGVGFC